jgi:hypothetical protein
MNKEKGDLYEQQVKQYIINNLNKNAYLWSDTLETILGIWVCKQIENIKKNKHIVCTDPEIKKKWLEFSKEYLEKN